MTTCGAGERAEFWDVSWSIGDDDGCSDGGWSNKISVDDATAAVSSVDDGVVGTYQKMTALENDARKWGGKYDEIRE